MPEGCIKEEYNDTFETDLGNDIEFDTIQSTPDKQSNNATVSNSDEIIFG